MRKGLVRITPHVIKEALRFPFDWEIESMNTVIIDNQLIIKAVISGNDFPKEGEDGTAKECELIVHTERFTYEVKERKGD